MMAGQGGAPLAGEFSNEARPIFLKQFVLGTMC